MLSITSPPTLTPLCIMQVGALLAHQAKNWDLEIQVENARRLKPVSVRDSFVLLKRAERLAAGGEKKGATIGSRMPLGIM